MTIAALFVCEDSIYKSLPGVDSWDVERDARCWPGGMPAIAHPPCRAWGAMRPFAKPRHRERDLANMAVNFIRRYGGVLEHPKRSQLWPEMDLPHPRGAQKDEFGGWTLAIPQFWFGHQAEKMTYLYLVGCGPGDLPPIPMILGEAPRVIGTRLRKHHPRYRKSVTYSERESTPPLFAHWLCEVVRRCQNTST